MKGNNPLALPIIVVLIFTLVLGGYGVSILIRNALKLPTAQEAVDSALKLRDPERINQALGAVAFGRGMPRADVLEGLKTAGRHAHPEVRLYAAELLYIMGDTSGRTVLVPLMEGGPAVEDQEKPAKKKRGHETDIRVRAAGVLGKYRDHAAGGAVTLLYRRTQFEDLLTPLVLTHAEGAADLVKTTLGGKPPSELQMELLGRLKAQDQADYLAGIHQDAKATLPLRLAAAWAHSQILPETDASSAAVRFIHSQVEGNYKKRAYSENGHQAVKYLGSLKDEKSVQLLERVALDSPQTPVMQTAVVNLVMLHPNRSSVGRKLVVKELTTPGKFGQDLAIQLASSSGLPDLTQAGEDFDKRRAITGETVWKQEGEERRQWSIWFWAGDHLMVEPSK